MRTDRDTTPGAEHLRVLDRATGGRIDGVKWADTETRELGILEPGLVDGYAAFVTVVATDRDWWLLDTRTGEEYIPHG